MLAGAANAAWGTVRGIVQVKEPLHRPLMIDTVRLHRLAPGSNIGFGQSDGRHKGLLRRIDSQCQSLPPVLLRNSLELYLRHRASPLSSRWSVISSVQSPCVHVPTFGREDGDSMVNRRPNNLNGGLRSPTPESPQ